MELQDIQYNAIAKSADIERAFRRAELAGLTRERRAGRRWLFGSVGAGQPQAGGAIRTGLEPGG